MAAPSPITETVTIDGVTLTLETGRLARQAHGSVVVRQGDAFLLATVVSDSEPRPGADFFPLTVEYREKMSAGGRIPGSYLRREGRISDAEILTSRLIDRTLRPLFPKGFKCETQIIITVYGADEAADLDSLAMIGAAAAVHISDVPCEGPVGGLRVVRCDGELRALPTRAQRDAADLDVMVSASPEGVVMVEGEAKLVSEEAILDALDHGAKAVAPLFEALERLRDKAGKPRREFVVAEDDAALTERVRGAILEAVDAALETDDKAERRAALGAARELAVSVLGEDELERAGEAKKLAGGIIHDRMRARILDGWRIAGRGHDEVREITIEVGLVPSNHGSALFTRGETQALVSATIGSERDSKDNEDVYGRHSEPFLLHYNFPPFSVGETKPMRGPGRREVGHGNLAWRALKTVMPGSDVFPYAVRVLSDVTESNGSSSMATVCGGALALASAGVPISAQVAGIAMGLIAEGDRIAVLSDILGDEDHLGDMDFKVAGTKDGISAVQLDNKIGSLPREVLAKALDQAGRGRRHILEAMEAALEVARSDDPGHGAYAPKMIRIDPSKIGLVIGRGGSTIQDIEATSGAKVDIKDDGRVFVLASSGEATDKAIKRIEALTEDLKVGGIYKAKVVNIVDFGVFVRFLDHEGLVHVSELAEGRVGHPSDVVKMDDEFLIRITGVDDRGRLQLSKQAAAGADESEALNA